MVELWVRNIPAVKCVQGSEGLHIYRTIDSSMSQSLTILSLDIVVHVWLLCDNFHNALMMVKGVSWLSKKLNITPRNTLLLTKQAPPKTWELFLVFELGMPLEGIRQAECFSTMRTLMRPQFFMDHFNMAFEVPEGWESLRTLRTLKTRLLLVAVAHSTQGVGC